jgi:hypothetical protein
LRTVLTDRVSEHHFWSMFFLSRCIYRPPIFPVRAHLVLLVTTLDCKTPPIEGAGAGSLPVPYPGGAKKKKNTHTGLARGPVLLALRSRALRFTCTAVFVKCSGQNGTDKQKHTNLTTDRPSEKHHVKITLSEAQVCSAVPCSALILGQQ